MQSAVAVDEYNGRLTIVIPWRRFVSGLVAWTLLGLFACLGFGGIGAGLIIDKKDAAPVGGLVFCALSVGLITYVFVAYWLNRTTIEVTKDSITGEHGPLPFPRSRPFRMCSHDIDQVYVQTTREVKARQRGEHGFLVMGARGPLVRVSYQMCAQLYSGERVELFHFGFDRGRTLDEAKTAAKRLEAQVEAFLAIDDRPVDADEMKHYVP